MPVAADCDATAAVPFEVFCIGIVASIKHVLPCYIFRCFTTVLCSAVSFIMATAQAPARFCVTVAKLFALHDGLVATIAAAQPEILAIALLDGFEGDQSTEALAGDIYEGRHGGLLSRLPCQVAAGALTRSSGCAILARDTVVA